MVKVILIIFWLLSMKVSFAQDTSVFQHFSIQPTDSATFLALKNVETESLSFDSTSIVKVENEIRLPLRRKWNPYAVFNDSISELEDPNESPYQYKGMFSSIGIYLVEEQLYESRKYHLIEDLDGGITTVWNSPLVSPEKKHLANISLPCGLEGIPNGIQIWRINEWYSSGIVERHISIENILELNQQLWIPLDFVWENENSIVLKVESLGKWINEEMIYDNETPYYLRLAF